MTHARIPDFSQPAPVRTAQPASSVRRRLPTDGRFLNLPNEPLPGELDAWEIVEPIRPETPHARAFRFLDVAGELLAAVFIIGGGMVLTGLASLL
ncbi:hypothetical protein [Methylobacterium pseudosasicola]|uniref:Uncharacterized protein n=1 Tax=Methylobacterium pseudosasicola TaxID=582667 RepID=A0A1I4VH13_9HYPH|nr:hypothetical protein [Methylobacterium pseudosasicola]SFN00410.1 hypothetical protein SAMN05192568_11006 [Methylobacterium pseudosasicola]